MSCKETSSGLLNTQVYSHLLPFGKGRLRGEKPGERTVKINRTETLVCTFDNVPVILKHGKDGCTDNRIWLWTEGSSPAICTEWATVGTDLCTEKWQIWFNLSCWNSHIQNIRRPCPWLQSRFSLYLAIWPSCYTYSAVLVWHQEPGGIPTPLIFLYAPASPSGVIWHIWVAHVLHHSCGAICLYPWSCFQLAACPDQNLNECTT